jgi:hypothetical protein
MTDVTKATPFEYVERTSQLKRTVEVLARLAQDPKLRPYLIVDLPELEGTPLMVGGVEPVGAKGSMNYVRPLCSHCRKTIRLGKWRLEIFALKKGRPPVAFQFGERFCSHGCGEEFSKAFIEHGLRFQSLDFTPERCLSSIELNKNINHRLN